MPQELTKKEYTYQLNGQSEICTDIEENLLDCNYICDLISEHADSCVDIYNHDLWKTASDFQEWTEEAIDSGLCETSAMGGTDLIKIFQAGQYQYYTQMVYDNEKEIYFNVYVELYNNLEDEDKEILSKHFEVEEKFEEFSEDLDHNDIGSVIQDNFDELLDEAKEIEEVEDVEEKFEVDEVVEHRMRRAGRWNV